MQLPSYGERYVLEHGVSAAQGRVDYLNNRIQAEILKRPINSRAIDNLIDEAENIRKAIHPVS